MASEWVDETCSTPSQQTRILVVDDRALVYRKKFSRHARARGSLQVRRHPSVRPDLRRRGCMRLSPGVPATAKTLYNMASLTKPVTAEAVFRHSCPCFSARLPTCGGKKHILVRGTCSELSFMRNRSCFLYVDFWTTSKCAIECRTRFAVTQADVVSQVAASPYR
jgi:hypothetical protein